MRDPYTAGHSRRVAAYSRLLALDMGLSAYDAKQIEHAALLHDIGKVGVPDAVLFKNGPLDDEERLLIRGHPVVGAGLLADIPAMCDIYPCILHHHERFDGRGYPDGLIGDEIPIGARIIAVADSFDAMTSRPAHAAPRLERQMPITETPKRRREARSSTAVASPRSCSWSRAGRSFRRRVRAAK